MGQYYKTVNLDKKEYLHPHNLGNGLKLMEQVGAEVGTASALMLLLACSNGRGGGDAAEHEVIGRWSGDRIAVIGDYARPDDIPGVNAGQIYDECSDEGEYTDISDLVVPILEDIFNVTFTGTGWRDIVPKGSAKPTEPKAIPDMILLLGDEEPEI